MIAATAEALETAEPFNPFPGLRSFEPEEDYLFFGRERQIDELLRRLRLGRFLAVVGTSGSGKSSLVKSGMIPSLMSGFMTAAGSSWRVAILRPGDDPIGNLAAALTTAEILGLDEEPDAMHRAFAESTLRRSSRGLVDFTRQAGLPADDNLLVVADQFEELFRFKRSTRVEDSRAEALAFVRLLLEASRQEEFPIYVVFTMRSDFIGNCTEFPGLAEATNDAQFLIPRMSRGERRSAIVGPVKVGGGEISPRLVRWLLNDVGDNPDQLPILQHALMRTWDYWQQHRADGEPLDLRHYEAIGTMSGALSQHAEEAFRELASNRQQEIAEKLFKAITDKGSDARGIRRPCKLEEICADAEAEEAEVIEVIERFRLPGRSFLMPPAGVPLNGESVIDISHESLMRIWGRLMEWVDEEARAADTYRRLSKSAALFQAGQGGLWRDPELQLGLNWRQETRPTAAWARRYEPNFERAMLFLESSETERDLENERREQRRKRELRRTRRWMIIFGVLFLGALLLSFYAFKLKLDADSLRTEAEFERREALAARNDAVKQQQKAQEERQRADDEAEKAKAEELRAREEAERAERESSRAKEKERQAQAARREAIDEREKAEVAEDEAKKAQAKALASARDALEQKERAEESRAEARRLAMLQLARALAIRTTRLEEGESELAALLALQAFRLNRESGGEPRDASIYSALWSAAKRLAPELAVASSQHRDAVRGVALAAGGTLASGGDDGAVFLADIELGDKPNLLEDLGTEVRALVFDPAGERLAAGAFDGAIRIWDLGHRRRPPLVLSGHGSSVNALAFRPDGGRLASGGSDRSIALWDLTDPAAAPTRIDAPERVLSLAWSPDGDTLASAAGGEVLLWDALEPSAEPRKLAGGQAIRALAFDRDGRRLAGGSQSGPVVLWELGGGARSELAGHAAGVTALAFGPTGVLASASLDGSVRLWNVGRPEVDPIVLDEHRAWVWTVAFSADGRRVVSGGADRFVRVWPTGPEPLVDALCERVSRSLSTEEWNDYLSPEIERQPACPRK